MDDLHRDPRKGLPIRHASECNRLEKLVLSQAYERLLSVICHTMEPKPSALPSTGRSPSESLMPTRVAKGA